MSNENVRKLLEKQEGLKLHPYRCTSGDLTIGYGRNLDDTGISLQEARAMLDNDITYFETKLLKYPWFKKQDSVRKAAIVSMAFNLGMVGFLKFSKTIGALHSKDYTRAAREMLDSKWARQVKGRAVELSEMIRTGKWPEQN